MQSFTKTVRLCCLTQANLSPINSGRFSATYAKNSTTTSVGMISYIFGNYPREYFQKVDRLSFFVFYDQSSYDNNWLVDFKTATVTVKDEKGVVHSIDNPEISYKSSGIPHCQNSCHPHLNNPNGGKGDNHGAIQCRTQTSNIKQTAIA